MNRRYFRLSIAAAIFLTQQLREAIAQDAGQSSSSVDSDSTRRMRDAAGNQEVAVASCLTAGVSWVSALTSVHPTRHRCTDRQA